MLNLVDTIAVTDMAQIWRIHYYEQLQFSHRHVRLEL
jgi:hypothetical protein